MSRVAIGEKVPHFTAPITGDRRLKLSELEGRYVVLYFYPKDNTPGCTVEGQEFRDLHSEFKRLNTVILGASRDSLKSHENFKARHGFPFELISDPDETLCRAFDVIREKHMYGRKLLGVERSTFLIGPDGRLLREWRKVKAGGHAAQVLAAVREAAGG